jgi:hypothetical protein
MVSIIDCICGRKIDSALAVYQARCSSLSPSSVAPLPVNDVAHQLIEALEGGDFDQSLGQRGSGPGVAVLCAGVRHPENERASQNGDHEQTHRTTLTRRTPAQHNRRPDAPA